MEKDKNYYINQNIDNSGVASTKPTTDVVTRMAMQNPTISNLNVGQYFDKQSQYDFNMGDVRALEQQGINVNDVRAAKQSTWDKLGNAVVNNVVIAGTTAVSSSIGLLDGLFEAAYYGDASKIWDNSVNNYLVGVQQSAQEAMPIYRGKDYEEASVWGRLTTDVFWADMIQNLGYTEGMLLPAGGMTKLLANAPKLLRRTLPTLINSVGEASTEAINAKNESIDTKMAAAAQQYTKAYSTLEGDPLAQELLYDDYLKTISEIKEDAVKAGNFVFAANTALLAATSTFEFSSLLDRGFGTAKRLNGVIKKTGKGFDSNYTVNVARQVGETAVKKVADSFAEGMEEFSQGVISGTTDNYAGFNRFANSEFNPQKIEATNDLLNAMGQTFSESMHDKDAMTEFMAGAFTGGIGVPMFKGGKPILANNAIGELYGTYKEAKRLQGVADEINNRLANSKKTKAYYNGVVRHLAAQDRINTSIDNDDAFDYHNARAEQLISDIIMFDEAGDIETLREIINESVDTSSDEAIQELIKQTINPQTGEGPFVNNGVIEDFEEIRRTVEEKRQVLNNKITQYLEEKKAFQLINPKANEDQQKAVMYLGMQRRDHFDRYKSLSKEITKDVNDLVELIGSLDPATKGKLQNVGELYLSGGEAKQAVDDLLNSSLVPQATRDQIKGKLNDLQKLKTNLEKLTEEYNNITSNPNKATEIKEKAKKEAEQNMNSKNTIDIQQRVQNSSVSAIVNSHYDGIEDINSLETEVNKSQGFQPNKDKVKEAKGIIESRASVSRKLDNKVNNQEITEEEKNDALNLLTRSALVSQSRDELMDLNTETYNNTENIEVENDIVEALQQEVDAGNIEEEDAREAIAQIKQERIDKAKTILNELFEEERKRIAAANKVPDTINSTAPEINNTGHDSVDANIPVNGVNTKTETNKEIATRIAGKHTELIPQLEQYLDAADTILSNNPNINKEEYEKLLPKSTVGDISTRASIAEAALDKFNNRNTPEGTTVINTPSAPTTIDELDERTSWDNSDVQLQNQKEETLAKVNGTYTHWGPMTSEEARGNAKGDHSPYYKREGIKNASVLEILYKFLEKHNVFNNIRNNKVKPGDKIHFGFSKELNNQGVPVLLILNENNEVIGDLPLPTDATFNAYAGLSEYYNNSIEFYNTNKDNFEGDIVVVPGESTVSKMMIGKPNYSTQRKSLNDISTLPTTNGNNSSQGFKLGIAIGNERGTRSRIMVDAGRRKSEGPSALEDKVLQPLNATKGQPFVLVETSDPNRKYICVPFSMPLFESNSELGTLVQEHINSLTKVGTNQDALIKWCDELKDLLAIQDIKVYVNENGSYSVHLQINKNEEPTVLRESTENIPQVLSQALFNKASYQVSRKYINSTYKGKNYNELIGAVAITNLDSMHTVNDWFTINPIIEGIETKAKNPKSLGLNPNANSGNRVRIADATGYNYELDEQNNLYNEEGSLLEGDKYNTIKAYAYGIRNKEPMTTPYNTPWGTYYPQEARLEVSESEITLGDNLDLNALLDDEDFTLDNIDSNSPGNLNREEALKKLEEDDLISNEEREQYLNKASDSNLSKLANLPTVITKQKLTILDIMLNDSSTEVEVNEAIEKVLNNGNLLREVKEESIEESIEEYDLDKEIEKVQKMLPQLSKEEAIRIRNGLLKISNSRRAYGAFRNGIVTISDEAARGTVYHEAFHYVSQTLLTEEELSALYKEAKEHFGTQTNLATEEELAESFRKYMQNREDSGFFSNVLSDLKHIVKRLFGKASRIDKLFFDIRRGRLSKRVPVIVYNPNQIKSATSNNNDFSTTNDNIYYREKTNLYRKDTYTLMQELEHYRWLWRVSHSKQFQDEMKNFNGKVNRNWDKAYDIIKKYKLGEVAYAFEGQYGAAKIGLISRQEFINRANKIKAKLQETYESELSKDEVLSNQALQEQEERVSYYENYSQEIEQYYRDKLEYNNLTQEDKDYIKERGIPLEEYNNMSIEEKETLFKCKY